MVCGMVVKHQFILAAGTGLATSADSSLWEATSERGGCRLMNLASQGSWRTVQTPDCSRESSP